MFVYDARTGATVPVEKPGEDTSEGSSTESELTPHSPLPAASRKRKDPEPVDMGYLFEIELESRDLRKLADEPRRADLWLSKRMHEKGREVWCPEERGSEISELANVDITKIMKMRWVLTVKSDGKPKARPVVCGYQAPNLVEVQAASPTLSKLGKMLLLSIMAKNSWVLESADVTSAFLQSLQNLEDEDLLIWAPAELGAAYGGDGKDDSTILKICRAFYGLVHAPRKWYETVDQKLREAGWRRMMADRCIYCLFDHERLVGVAGIHVDDFILGGDAKNDVFIKARNSLKESFEWGKWESGNFEFAGMNIDQRDDGTIFIDHKVYSEKWMEEIPLRSREQHSQLRRPLSRK